MTIVLRPLLTRSLWLDVLRQAIGELFRCIDRVTDSVDVFMRIIMAGAGIAVSSVFLLYVYPVLASDLQLLALCLTGFLWYLCLYQIKPEHEFSVLPSLLFIVAVVSVAIPVFGLGLYRSNIYWAIIGNAMISALGPTLGVFFAVKLTELMMNSIITALAGLELKPGEPLTQDEKQSLTLANVILGEKPSLPDYIKLLVYALVFAILAVGLLSHLPIWPWSVLFVLIAAVSLRLTIAFISGAILASDPEIDKATMTYQVRKKSSFRSKLQAFAPLTSAEAAAVKANRRFKLFTIVLGFGQLIFAMLYPLLTTSNIRVALLFTVIASIVGTIAFVLCMIHLDFVNKRLLKTLEAARA